MPANNNLQFQGFREAEQLLDALGKKVGGRELQKILRNNLQITVERGRELVPRDDGDLAKSLGVINGRGAGRGVSVYGGPRRSSAYKGYHGHLVEFGTAPRFDKDGNSTGTMPAQPFWRPAWDQTKDQVLEGIRLDLQRLLTSDFSSVRF